MTDKQDKSSRDAKHPREEQSEKGDQTTTGAGQEATNNAPSDHTHEHQSNYGGGGANRGASKS